MLPLERGWDIIFISTFLLGGGLFAMGALIIASLVAPKTKGHFTHMPYECGVPPFGQAWVRFGINYYFYALIFLAFDVDVLYLFPVGLIYRLDFGGREIVEVVIFVTILLLAVLFVWSKGALRWGKR